jgi:hypothetical protein
MASNEIGMDTTVCATRDHVAAEVGDEVVILNLKDEVYYGLGSVGARIWELVQKPRRVSDLRDTIVAEYDVEASEAQRDILGLLADLAERGLVEVQPEQA